MIDGIALLDLKRVVLRNQGAKLRSSLVCVVAIDNLEERITAGQALFATPTICFGWLRIFRRVTPSSTSTLWMICRPLKLCSKATATDAQRAMDQVAKAKPHNRLGGRHARAGFTSCGILSKISSVVYRRQLPDAH